MSKNNFDLRRLFTLRKLPQKLPVQDETALNGESFSLERLQIRALELASTDRVNRKNTRGFNLLARLEDNKNELVKVFRALSNAEFDYPLTPSGEWLVDNFHIVEEQMREVKQDLPRKFYRELPKLESGNFANYPRIYRLAYEIVANTDNLLDAVTLESFLESYQTVLQLSIGEIWAFPISLRLALIENLRSFAVKILQARIDRTAADKLADLLAEFSGFSGKTFELLAENFDGGSLTDKFSRAFLVQFAARLHEGEDFVGYALEKIEHRLRPEGVTLESLAHQEHSRQATAQVSVGNIITSMRLLSTLDWNKFFENVSRVERVLRTDKQYGEMDFATRDSYRHEIERIAKKTQSNEINVAQTAIDLAKNHATDNRQSHVGYYLINSEGLPQLEKSVNYSATITEKTERLLHQFPTAFYLSSIVFFSIVFLTIIVLFAAKTTNIFGLISIVLLAFVPASELALILVNRLVHALLKPRLLPKMELNNGIPETARTIVVIPTLLSDTQTIKELYGKLEVYCLANRDQNLFFALLGDLKDAENETMPEDKELCETARNIVCRLNEKYPAENKTFYFFTRQREWNEGEEKWICRERKRGNLHEFNQLLRGKKETNFTFNELLSFDLLKTIRYVITLDTDTQLPRDAAKKLVGTIEHPLNFPVFDTAKGRVTKGYAILQPRIEISLTSSLQTRFSRIFSAGKGFDPYTNAVSDVYQDLFTEGSYVGKGLYEIDAFEASLYRRIPKNELLSHDLFEGLYARVALLTDIVFYDDYPKSYKTFAFRQHRWTRGDWQIMRWLLPFVSDSGGEIVRNRLPLIARFKIFDNLRRSLVAPMLLIWLALAWVLPILSPLFITLFSLIILTSPLVLQALTTWVNAVEKESWKIFRLNFANFGSEAKATIIRIFFRLAFLPDEAALTVDAIFRTFYRKIISRKRLLEWVTAAQSEQNNRQNFADYYLGMSASTIISTLIFAFILIFNPPSLLLAAPFLIVWMIAPYLAFRLGLPKNQEKTELNLSEILWLRQVARRTWRYFETFVGESEHWLPPDNFQQDPTHVIAHRTSPTNIGLLLLSTLAARDFGYIGTLETVERLELTCMTLERLTKFRGHFLNWYDTQTLEPLIPQYISTVDSGNLAGHLIAVAEGCLELGNEPLFGERTRQGFADTLGFIKAEIIEIEKANLLHDAAKLQTIKTAVKACEIETAKPMPENRIGWKTLFSALITNGEKIAELTAEIWAKPNEFPELSFWTKALINLAKNCERDLQTLFLTDESDDKFSQIETARQNFKLRAESIAVFCRRICNDMDFEFLYDREKKVLTIGYRPIEGTHDNSFYDLLASEARLASFISIATGDVEQEHWFRLGRGLVSSNGNRSLISWSGTMFEYLMPLLVMRNYEKTLLDETYRAIVERQIKYGNENGIPWGISESAYNARDLNLNFQYAPFGVPDLGLKRGLCEDLVIAPYATALALSFAPLEAIANLKRLANEGMLAGFGFYEAVDYTKNRIPPKQISARIESYMSHHQGMIFVALDNFLNADVMQKRFHRNPIIESAEMLLQERVPGLTEEIERPQIDDNGFRNNRPTALIAAAPRYFTSANQPTPQVCLLSNGNYTVMLTTAGSGFSRVGNYAVSRWREDAECDDWGHFFYLHDVRSGAIWSSGFQPTLREPQNYEAIFTESKAEFKRRDAGIFTHTEIIVATEDDAELRRISITNESSRTREIEIISYAEIVLNEQAEDESHRAFSNMFIETEYFADRNILLANRRKRSAEDTERRAAHTVSWHAETVGEIGFETDREKFIGRAGNLQNPFSVSSNAEKKGTVGVPLDPIFSLKIRVLIKPNETATLFFSTVVADTLEKTLALSDKYRDPQSFERTEKLAWIRSQVELRHLGISTDEAHLFQQLAGHLIYADKTLRPRQRILKLNQGTQKDLWKYGIGGDLPLMIVRISEGKDARSGIRQILRGHAYLHSKQLLFDLLILNDQPSSYEQSFNEDLQAMIRSGGMQTQIDTPGGVFLRRTDIMSDGDRITLHTAARVCFVNERGTLAEEVARKIPQTKLPLHFIPQKSSHSYRETHETLPETIFSNNFGGFNTNGKEYFIRLEKGKSTPAPWTNVIANENGFGFLTTETGSGVTWSNNSHENRLTSWSNDAVSNSPPECIYLRDEETGSFWTPTALPIREDSVYCITHGSGYSIFKHTSHGIKQELLVFSPVSGNVKISRLRLQNLSGRTRKLSVTYFTELVLGVSRAKSAPFIITQIDAATGAIIAKNPYNNDFAERVAFVATSADTRTWTCDRREFIGNNSSLSRPDAMLRTHLSGAIGAGFDPCAALQTDIEIQPDETREIIFLLGEEDSTENAQRSIFHHRQKLKVEEEFNLLNQFWDKTLGTIQVKTPDESLNVMMNRHLLYQTLACRFWARTAFYQSSGAFGFRDQLQDAMALIYTRPDLARNHICKAAAHQFKQGDVQHWWHEPSNAGTRTRISDNLIWLVFVTCFYAEKTSDSSIFDEIINFLDAPVLAEGEAETYLKPIISNQRATIFEHCIRTIEKSLPLGQNGLPLIGAGDWSDGLNRVGIAGTGESVWLAWFFAKSLEDFSAVCQERNETELAAKYRRHAKLLVKNIEKNAWDGDWYLRAFYDDATPLGSHLNDECQIDSIAQSWSVISGKGKPERSELAMQSVDEKLINIDEKLVLLLTPPFDKTMQEPGYIKGYPAGIRENGGQYTHAAVWAIIAFSLMGDGDKAQQIFSLLNPINRTRTNEEIEKYKTEPYVIAADIYSNPNHLGRGGWTWYTGASGWLYRAALENILGFELRGETLTINPCIPHDWKEFEIIYRFKSTTYNIKVENPNGVCRGVKSIENEGALLLSNEIELFDNNLTYNILVILG